MSRRMVPSLWCWELATEVVVHEHWATLPKDGTVVAARTQLKHHPDAQPDAQPDEAPATPAAAVAA
ncbi:hypothetical protein [Streptomyces laurentii]|uniref:hypothetical protein n=1 Tax=Streptomyces laurentii TaxID=39478 RepID=UPI0036938646